ncbi:MBL fold metallo-hydrolase [Saccharothrix sp.]|uniref:MBL fold metallo-hydrolase n=1 Tax=Saccharothrix sp. TaxID=1873460 RepID=UPI0028110284|nr:MBL fold metallo-hydrolase [Saccharothrix sp.]
MDVLEDYTGHVTPNGPAARRTLGELTITKVSVGPMDNNAYLLVCRATNEALLIDAAADPTRLSDLVGHSVERPRLKTVVTTHRHQDHWGALGAVAGANGSNTVAHELDAPVLPIPPDQLVSHGDTVMVGQVPLTVIHLRGHTPGSIALLYRSPSEGAHLFTGDSLFPGGVGRTTSPEDFTSLFNDVKERIFDVLPDDTWFYPGHGDDSTLGRERPHLEEWRARGW